MKVYKYDKNYNYEIININHIDIKTLSNDYIYFEKLEGKVKPFFDIDIYNIQHEPNDYLNYYNNLFNLIFPDGKIAISTSHKKYIDDITYEKLSFHFVINNYEYELKDLDDFVNKHPILSIDNNIDKTIYSPRPDHYVVNFLGHEKLTFRLLYSYKSYEDKRKKIPYNYIEDLSKHVISLT